MDEVAAALLAQDRRNACKPIHLGERLVQVLEETKITINKGSLEVSLMDLIDSLLANPQDIDITIR